jgi:hypothetical protein
MKNPHISYHEDILAKEAREAARKKQKKMLITSCYSSKKEGSNCTSRNLTGLTDGDFDMLKPGDSAFQNKVLNLGVLLWEEVWVVVQPFIVNTNQGNGNKTGVTTATPNVDANTYTGQKRTNFSSLLLTLAIPGTPGAQDRLMIDMLKEKS